MVFYAEEHGPSSACQIYVACGLDNFLTSPQHTKRQLCLYPAGELVEIAQQLQEAAVYNVKQLQNGCVHHCKECFQALILLQTCAVEALNASHRSEPMSSTVGIHAAAAHLHMAGQSLARQMQPSHLPLCCTASAGQHHEILQWLSSSDPQLRQLLSQLSWLTAQAAQHISESGQAGSSMFA